MESKKHHRSLTAIQACAFKQNLQRELWLWLPEELEILKKYYPVEGGEAHKRFNSKTAAQCRSCAGRLGLKSPVICWTEAEETILIKYYRVEGGEIYKRFNGKFNKHQCMQHAGLIGLKATTNSADKWTEEDNEILRQYYPIEGKECYKRIQNANKQTVVCQASKLGLKFLGSKVAPTRVRCLETGEIFNTQSEAQKKYPGHLTDHLKGKRPSSGKLPDGTKLHWEYVDKEDLNK